MRKHTHAQTIARLNFYHFEIISRKWREKKLHEWEEKERQRRNKNQQMTTGSMSEPFKR